MDMARRIARAMRFGLVAALLVAAAPALAIAPVGGPKPPEKPRKIKFKTFETWGFRADMPSDWKQWKKEKADGAKLYDGKWYYRSPNKNFRVRIKVRRDDMKRTFAEVA